MNDLLVRNEMGSSFSEMVNNPLNMGFEACVNAHAAALKGTESFDLILFDQGKNPYNLEVYVMLNVAKMGIMRTEIFTKKFVMHFHEHVKKTGF